MMQSERVTKICETLEEHVDGTLPVLVEFLRQEVEKAGFDHVVFGLSGGIDSTVVAYLAVAAFGRTRVHPIMMPYKLSSAASVADAKQVAADLDLPLTLIEITPQIDAYFAQQENATPLRMGNKMARERMSIIYDQSALFQALPLGTSNKTELLLGYGTQFGDLASALNPIGDLYKTQIRRLAHLLAVPMSIIEKPPSADLWENQTDEGEFGFTYEEADAILHLLIDQRLHAREVIEQGFNANVVASITRRIRQNQYKRRMPIIAKLSSRTIGVDFRYSRDWGM